MEYGTTFDILYFEQSSSNGPSDSGVTVTEFLTITFNIAAPDPFIKVAHRVLVRDNRGAYTAATVGTSTCQVRVPQYSYAPDITTSNNGVLTEKNYTLQFGSSFSVIVDGSGSNTVNIGRTVNGVTTYIDVRYSATVHFAAAYILITCPYEGFVFVDTITPFKAVLLPQPSGNTNKMIFIKDKSWNASINNITVIAPSGVNIDGANTFTIKRNGGCLTLVSDGTQYWIANYCDPSIEFSYGISAITEHTAVANKFNTFTANTDNKGGVYLPSATSGTICIIHMSASINGLGVLFISSAIDNNTVSTNPYISNDVDSTPISAVFISDGSTWYSAGTMNGSKLTQGTSTSSNEIILSKHNNFIKSSTYTNYYLPDLLFGSTEQRGLSIFKTIGPNTITYCSEQSKSSIIIASGKTSVECAFLGCIWFIHTVDNNSNHTSYYPIIKY